MTTELRILNESGRPDWQIEYLCRFAMERATRCPPLAVRAMKPGAHDYPSGLAHCSSWPQWALRLYPRRSKLRDAMYALTVRSITDCSPVLGHPRVTWHVKAVQDDQSMWEMEEKGDDYQPLVARAWREGKTKLRGGWPIFVTYDWAEAFLHTFAHELSHALQHQHSGKVGSEVRCETFAARVLTDYARLSGAMRDEG